MLNSVYQLITPRTISVKHEDVDTKDQVIIRPEYLALCHADQNIIRVKRYKDFKEKSFLWLLYMKHADVLSMILQELLKSRTVCCNDTKYTWKQRRKVIYENYGKGGGFLSSGHDGFMREFVNLPADRVVAFDDIDKRIAAITEFISVGMHAYLRFSLISHEYKNSIGIWGDGSLAFIVSSILKKKYPDTKIIVIGKNTSKLSQFSFVDETILADDLEEGFNVDHAFECAGGEEVSTLLIILLNISIHREQLCLWVYRKTRYL